MAGTGRPIEFESQQRSGGVGSGTIFEPGKPLRSKIAAHGTSTAICQVGRKERLAAEAGSRRDSSLRQTARSAGFKTGFWLTQG